LADAPLEWFRSLCNRSSYNDVPAGEAVATCYALGWLALATPAWVEAYDTVAAAVGAGRPEPEVAAAVLAVTSARRPATAQVVGVDTSRLVLRRAEWVGESLHLELAPEVDDPGRLTGFRVVGAEPRMWYVTGIDRPIIDVSAHAVSVWVPCVAGPLAFTPGSY